MKYDVEDTFVQIKDDDLFDDGSEDRDILASIKSAESQLGAKMPTPKKLQQEKFRPVKYDVEDGI